eukprot:178939-Chlamydomonas_euryale.AAC.1
MAPVLQNWRPCAAKLEALCCKTAALCCRQSVGHLSQSMSTLAAPPAPAAPAMAAALANPAAAANACRTGSACCTGNSCAARCVQHAVGAGKALNTAPQPSTPVSPHLQPLSHTTWVLAKNSEACSAATRTPCVPLRAQALSNTLWALATLGRRGEHPAFVRDALQAATPMLGRFNQQDLASTAWALASLGQDHREFMVALRDAAATRLGEFTPQ